MDQEVDEGKATSQVRLRISGRTMLTIFSLLLCDVNCIIANESMSVSKIEVEERAFKVSVSPFFYIFFQHESN